MSIIVSEDVRFDHIPIYNQELAGGRNDPSIVCIYELKKQNKTRVS
jgi:hypothetical protein